MYEPYMENRIGFPKLLKCLFSMKIFLLPVLTSCLKIKRVEAKLLVSD